MRELALASALLFIVASCASDPMAGVRSAYERGDYAMARDELVKLQRGDAADAHLYGLELGVVYQALGEPKAAVAELRRARDAMDEHAKGNYTDWAGELFLDDRSTVWPGADYEHVLVRAMLATADLVSGGHDAHAYAFQVLAKQQEIIRSFEPESGESPKSAYKLVAFGNYIRATINEATVRGRSEAQREFAKVLEIAPDFPYAEADLERVTNGRFAAPGHGVVQILAMVGRGPKRVERREYATAAHITIAKAIWSIYKKRPFVPISVPLPIPAVEFRQDNPDAAAVFAGDKRLGTTATVTDIEALADAEFEAMFPWAMARAVIRRIVKTTIIEAGKEVVDHNQGDDRHSGYRKDALALALDIVGGLWAAAEHADLRCWNLLPAKLQALRVELPEGEHEITVRAVRDGNVVGAEQTVRVRVFAGFNTYVVVQVPTQRGGPQPLTSRPGSRPAPLVAPAENGA